jgi:hypothetical protein
MFLKQRRSFSQQQVANSRRRPRNRLTRYMKVIQVPDRPVSPLFYAVAGRLLFVESTDQRLGNLIERLCAGWQLTPVSFSERPPDIRIHFFSSARPQIPRDLNQFEIAEGGQCYTDGADLYVALGNSLMHLQHGDPVTVKIWQEGVPPEGEPMFAKVASFAICAGLRRFGMFEIHSAGMVHPESRKGVLIVGPSGSGKSMLALKLATAGWPYLSDDELLLSFAGSEVEARGFRSFFAVSSAIGTSKTCFEPDDVFPSQRRQHAIPGLLVFTRVTGEQKTELRKLTQVETMARLIRACPWATYDASIAVANLEVLSALARQTSAFDLHAGRDLLVPGVAADLLSQQLEQN